jgi:beta-N-acetylglucosaminidase
MTNINKKEGISRIVLTILVLVTFIFNISNLEKNRTLDSRISVLESQLQERQQTDSAILDHLKGIRQEQEEIKRINQERLELEKKRTMSVSNLRAMGFDKNTDLASNTDLSTEDMNKIIDDWNRYVKNGTRFKGKGAIFVEAAKESGLNPVYILAHAAEESKWGNSYIALVKNNFFGINCVDSNPGAGYAMGDNIDEGIISGAIWIKQNYYDKGHTTLQSMLDAGYASNTGWANNITNIANTSIRVL